MIKLSDFKKIGTDRQNHRYIKERFPITAAALQFDGARMPQLAQLRFAASVATVQAPSARPSALLPSAHRFAEPRGFKADRQTDTYTDTDTHTHTQTDTLQMPT